MGRLVYLAGYSRCGSTVLGILLGSHPEICYTGELTYLAQDWADPSRACACGRPYGECSFWSGALDGDDDAAAAQLRQVDRRRLGPRRRRAGGEEAEHRYRQVTAKVLAHARTRSGRSIVLDSSKSARDAARRPGALRHLLGEDVAVVHLVRRGQATVRSYTRVGSNWAAEGHGRTSRLPAARASVGWTLANGTASLAARDFPGRYLRLCYEDLLARPAWALGELGRFLDLDLAGVVEGVEAGRSFPVGHPVGGNRLRLAGEVRLRQQPPVDGEPGLDRRRRLVFGLCGGGLQAYYDRRAGEARMLR